MKFIRNARAREKAIDFASKAALIAFSALFCLWMISGARAADITSIHQGAAGEGEYAIDFAFSAPVKKDDVQVEFQRNFIQISLRGVSAYPARTEKLSHPLLEKVFTYQYQPDLARARVLLKVQASAIQEKASWEVTPQGLRIVVQGSGAAAPVAKALPAAPKVIAKAEKPKREVKDNVSTKSAATSSAPAAIEDPSEAQSIQQILAETKKGAKEPAKEPAKPEASKSLGEEQPIFAASSSVAAAASSKQSPATRIFTSLLLVVGVIGAIAIAFRRFVLGRGVSFKGMSFQRQNRMIETIASQSLGPKRSVALIRVLDQHMVVGMAGESMTLLANLGNSVNLDKYEDASIGASFADAFQGAISNDSAAASATSAPVAPAPNMRSAIKKRMEGFKPLRS